MTAFNRNLANALAAKGIPLSSGLVLDKALADVKELRARVAELEEQRERRRLRLVALQNDALNMRGTLSPNGEANKVPFTLGETLAPAVEWLVNRVAELESAAVEGRAALGALCYDLEDPGSNAFGALHLLAQATKGAAETTPDDAAEALAKRDAAVLRQAAEDLLMAPCPEHGDADEVWIDCPCEYAEELIRQAALIESGSTS